MFNNMVKMANHNVLGVNGENVAKLHLESIGYEVLFQNWRAKHLEVDLICKDADVLVFVEVKTRSSSFFQNPYESVDLTKQNKLISAAEHFLENYNSYDEIRFDIVSIVASNENNYEIEHIKDAFLPNI